MKLIAAFNSCPLLHSALGRGVLLNVSLGSAREPRTIHLALAETPRNRTLGRFEHEEMPRR